MRPNLRKMNLHQLTAVSSAGGVSDKKCSNNKSMRDVLHVFALERRQLFGRTPCFDFGEKHAKTFKFPYGTLGIGVRRSCGGRHLV